MTTARKCFSTSLCTLIGALLVLCLCAPSWADEGKELPPNDGAAPAAATVQAPQSESADVQYSYKSPSFATLLALATPVVFSTAGVLVGKYMKSNHDETDHWLPQETAAILLFLGLVPGPSAGHLYTGHYGRASLFSAGRGISLASAVGGVFLMALDTFAGSSGGYGTALGAFVALSGGVSWVGLTLLEIGMAAPAAHEINGRNASKATLSLAPTLLPTTDAENRRSFGLGLSLSGHF